MANGKVKWFNNNKRFGFITPDDGGKDIFVHMSSLEKAGLNGLKDDQKVSFDVEDQNGKLSAINLKLL